MEKYVRMKATIKPTYENVSVRRHIEKEVQHMKENGM